MTPTRRAIPLLLVLTLTAIPLAQPPSGWDNLPGAPSSLQDRDGIPTLHTRVQLVLQDITVTDAAGHTVTGLKPEDFHISEDGRPQTIKNFEEHSPIDPALAAQRAAELAHTVPPGTFTNVKAFASDTVVVFFLDTLENSGCGSGVEAQMHLRQDMLDYMKTVPLGTPYMILQLDSHLHMLQNMTTDLTEITNTLHGKDNSPTSADFTFDVPGNFPFDAALHRRQVLSAAIKDLKQYLGAMPGRKNLVWFSGQKIPSLIVIVPGVGESKVHPTIRAYLDNITSTLEQSRISIYPMEATPVGGSGGLSIADDHPHESMYHDPNGQPINPPGWESQFVAEEEMYRTPVTCAYPEGKERIAAIVDRATHYYTLTYSPTNQNFNGQSRHFSVELADKSLRLEYRKSYLGSPADTAVQPLAAPPVQTAAAAAIIRNTVGPSIPIENAMGMGTIEPTQIVFEASVTPSPAKTKEDAKSPPSAVNFLLVKYRKQGYRDYTVHFRVRADELKLTSTPDQSAYTGKLEFVAVVYDNRGQAVNGKREHASISFPNLTDPQLQTAEVTGDLVIQVPAKGSYFLRLGVHDTATDRVGALEIPTDCIPVPPK